MTGDKFDSPIVMNAMLYNIDMAEHLVANAKALSLTPEQRATIATGSARYCGEWHTSKCAEETQGMWCECEEVRNGLAASGMVVKCPDGVSWQDYASYIHVLCGSNEP